MGKTQNNSQPIGPGIFNRGGFSALRGAVTPPNLPGVNALLRAQEKFSGQRGTVAELAEDPLWNELFSQRQQAADFAQRLAASLDPQLSPDDLAALVKALPRHLEYQNIIQSTGSARLNHLRELLSCPTAGVREFPLHLKTRLLTISTKLSDSLAGSAHSENISEIKQEIELELNGINQQLASLAFQEQTNQQQLAIANNSLIQQLYKFLDASNDPDDRGGQMADLAAIDGLWEHLFITGADPDLHRAQEKVRSDWYHAEYQALIAAVKYGQD